MRIGNISERLRSGCPFLIDPAAENIGIRFIHCAHKHSTEHPGLGIIMVYNSVTVFVSVYIVIICICGKPLTLIGEKHCIIC